jgi:lipopolysaccharide export LptBFGC system permease protein LptF
MSHVVSELTIQNLQVCAALLMGYDYFLSHRLKAKADAAAQAFLRAQHDLSAQQLAESKRSRNVVKVTTVLTLAFVVAAAVCLLAGGMIFRRTGSVWAVAVTAIVVVFFFSGALHGIARLGSVYVAPRFAPAVFLPFAKFLLFSSKGVIAALGFLLLIGSFVCRYANQIG